MINIVTKDVITELHLIPDEKFNILSPDKIKELITTLENVSSTQSKVVRISGHGGSFAVGANIKQMLLYDGYMAKGFSMLGNKLFNLMNELPQVIIAEIDGFCMGGGVDFAAAADFRYATKNSKFAHPGSQLGIITGFGGTQRLPRLMKLSGAYEMFMTGKMYDAAFMEENRFLNKTFDTTDEMKHYVAHISEKISRKNRLFLKELKHMRYGCR